MLPPFFENIWRTSLTIRFRLLVTTCTSTPTPPGPYPSNVTSSSVSPSRVPVPRWIARSILSLGMFSPLAARIAVRRRGFVTGSAPPVRAAIVNSRMSLVKILPRRASVAAFLCLIVAHLECPDMEDLWHSGIRQEQQPHSCRDSVAVEPNAGKKCRQDGRALHEHRTRCQVLDSSPRTHVRAIPAKRVAMVL